MGKLVTENHFGTDYKETELEAGLLWAALMKLGKKTILESENSKREGLMLLINYNVLGFTS